MLPSNPGPKWWQLYLAFPLLIVLFLMDARLRISTRGHQVVQIGILLLVYGLIHLWLRANAKALSNMNQRRADRRITVLRVPLPELPDADREKTPLFELPVSEIKGLLGETCDVEYIDGRSLPIDESRKN
jgi:hypothetical protein